MCLIIDINCLANVFDTEAKDHADFKPVKDWIVIGKGKMIIGGSQYLRELKRTPKYLNLIAELTRKRKTVYIPDQSVDDDMAFVAAEVQHPDFDDQHLVALLRCAGCRIICSLDERAYPYFQHKAFFASGKKPKIYSRKKNASLLTDANIADVCKK